MGLHVAYFPKQMRGRLDAKDWRPMIASSLIYRKILSREFPLGLLPLIGGTFLILVLGGAILIDLFGTNTMSTLVPFLAACPFVLNRLTRIRRGQRFRADVEVTKLVGKDSLLSVLHRIDEMGLDDVKERENRGFSRYFSGKPSVAERISNLSR